MLIARAIVQKRKEIPFTTTTQLADLVRLIVGLNDKDLIPASGHSRHSALCNDELGELEKGTCGF